MPLWLVPDRTLSRQGVESQGRHTQQRWVVWLAVGEVGVRPPRSLLWVQPSAGRPCPRPLLRVIFQFLSNRWDTWTLISSV